MSTTSAKEDGVAAMSLHGEKRAVLYAAPGATAAPRRQHQRHAAEPTSMRHQCAKHRCRGIAPFVRDPAKEAKEPVRHHVPRGDVVRPPLSA